MSLSHVTSTINRQNGHFPHKNGVVADDSLSILEGMPVVSLVESTASMKPVLPIPVPLPDMAAAPPLPDYAQLTEEEKIEASKTGLFLWDYVRFAMEASPMTPFQFHVGAGLSLVSTAVARRVHLRMGTESIYPNLYQIYVGPSTLQRKTTAMNTLTKLLDKAGMFPAFTLAETQTPEAFVEDMTLNTPSTYEKMSSTAKARWMTRRRLYAQRAWYIDEASRLMESFNRDNTAGMLPIVLDLYDSKERSGERNTKSWGNESIEKSYLNIFGATTFSSLSKHVSNPERWGDGFFPRFSFIACNAPADKYVFWAQPLEFPDSLVKELRRIAFGVFGDIPIATAGFTTDANEDDGQGEQKDRELLGIVVQPLADSTAILGDGVYDLWRRYSMATGFDMLKAGLIDGSVSAELHPSYGRFGTMLIKVAMLYAVMDAEEAPITIERRHILAAQGVVEMWRDGLHIIRAGGTATQARTFADKVWSALAQNGENWTSRRDLQRALNCASAELEPAIEDLVLQGVAERQVYTPPKGRKTEMYRIAITAESLLS